MLHKDPETLSSKHLLSRFNNPKFVLCQVSMSACKLLSDINDKAPCCLQGY